MSTYPKGATVFLALLFFGVNILSSPLLIRATYAAEQTPPFAPPWGPTQERVPQEVKDKENETPLAWCDNQERQEFEVTYVDSNTGTRTRIKRRLVMSENPPPGGSVRVPKVVWEITIDNTPGQPKRKITYDLEPGNETRTERVGKDKPTTRPIRESDMFDPKNPPPAKKSSLTPAFPSTQLARVDFRASDPLAPRQGESRSAYDLRMLLAATLERSKGENLKTQERPAQPVALNVKIVTYGDPPKTPPVIHLDDPPQTTPEEFVQKPSPVTWTPGDGEGPKTTPDDPKTGVPITYPPGTAINVGSGWASTRITKDLVSSCTGEDEEDATQASSQPRETPARTSQPRAPTPAPAPSKEDTTPTTVASAPKQACVWITVARTDIPDFASMLRERESKADAAIAGGVSDPAGAQQQCPVRRSMFQSPGFFPGDPFASRPARRSGAGALLKRAAPNGEMYAQASDPGPTVTSPTGPLPERKFGENRTDDVLIPERNRTNDIQDQMTRNAGRDDLLQGESWTRLQNSVEWATWAIRNCDREQLQFALDGILASTRRLQERKEALENLRDKVSAGLDKELGDLWKDIEALPKPIMEQSAGSKAATAGKIGLVLYELWRYFRHAHAPSPLLIPLDIYAVGSMFCTVSQWIDVKVQLKYNFPRLLDRLEKTNDLNLLIRQYEMRIEANQEVVNALGKLYDEHKCKKCVEPAAGAAEKPGTKPRTGSK